MTVVAITAAYVLLAPAAFKAMAQFRNVAPVVNTSSTNSMFFPLQLSLATKAPSKLWPLSRAPRLA